MNCFVTGANGLIGSRLVERLSLEGHTVTCMVRDAEKFIPANSEHLRIVEGDLDNKKALMEGLRNCDVVFHLAACAKPWSKDPELPFRINVTGTMNVLKASESAGVRKFIYTSSAAVLGPSSNGEEVNEEKRRDFPFFNAYESTKSMAESEALKFSGKVFDVVIVCPTRVYGPGPLNESNSVTKICKSYQEGNWRIIPGDGRKIGNYVFIEDVVRGHLLAAEKGAPGEKYILGGENLSFDEFFAELQAVTRKKRRMVKMPLGAMLLAAKLMEAQNRITGYPPPISTGWVKKYMHDWQLSSKKAVDNLGYSITPFHAGVQKTFDWLNSRK